MISFLAAPALCGEAAAAAELGGVSEERKKNDLQSCFGHVGLFKGSAPQDLVLHSKPPGAVSSAISSLRRHKLTFCSNAVLLRPNYTLYMRLP